MATWCFREGITCTNENSFRVIIIERLEFDHSLPFAEGNRIFLHRQIITAIIMNNFPLIPASKKSLSFRKPVFGHGINDAWYMVKPIVDGKQIICPYYKVWQSMFRRCYSDKYQDTKPTYKECSVCPEWVYFMSFRIWMAEQNWVGLELDKDILGNKIYSPGNCCFVDRQTNNILTHNQTNKGEYATGVSFHKTKGKFAAQCQNSSSKTNHLGYFDTEIEAQSVYLSFKSRMLNIAAKKQSNGRVKNALREVASEYKLKSIKLINELN